MLSSDGEYLVYSVEHSLSVQDGYFTTCHLRRNFCGVGNKNRSISEIDRERIDSQSANAQQEAKSSPSPAGGSQAESQNNTEENNTEKKNPSITNPRWEDTDGRTIAKALVGDEVYLCADVTDIADGATATIKVIEKDDDGNDDFITELNTTVNDCKILCKWKVIYTEDNDDTDSQKEMEEKGYTLPEYAFTVGCDGVESEESGQLDVYADFIAKLTFKGRPMKNYPYVLKLADGSYKTGETNDDGYIIENEIPIGKVQII